MLKAGLKYGQLRKEKREEKEAAYNNKKMLRSLYGTAHILKVEVMTQIQNNSNINAFCKGGEDRGGGGEHQDVGGAGQGIPVTREGGGAGAQGSRSHKGSLSASSSSLADSHSSSSYYSNVQILDILIILEVIVILNE